MKFIETFLGISVIASFVFFLVAQLSLPAENLLGAKLKTVYDGAWEQVKEDGSRETVQVPGQLDCVQGEWVTIESQLPEEIGHFCLVLRSLQQDMKVYIDGQLRKEYSTVDTQLFGKTSTIAYVIVDLKEEDAGKTMRIEFMSDSFYSGYMEEIL